LAVRILSFFFFVCFSIIVYLGLLCNVFISLSPLKEEGEERRQKKEKEKRTKKKNPLT